MSKQNLSWQSPVPVLIAIVLLVVLVPSLALAAVCVVSPGDAYYVEAENYSSLGNTFEVQDHDKANNDEVLKGKENNYNNPSGTSTKYTLAFKTPGTWYIWVRGNSFKSGNRDSLWYGLDGSKVGNITTPSDNKKYNWANIPHHGIYPNPAAIVIPSAGEYTIDFWSRETEFYFDGFYITQTGGEIPNGKIPKNAEVLVPGFCEDTPPVRIDNDSDGYTVDEGDCDDNDFWRNPGLDELCNNGKDDDCDDTTPDVCLVDNDNDGQSPIPGQTPLLDCNDNDVTIYVGAAEFCDGKDNDCDGDIDEGCDGDGDGYQTGDGDCNDNDASIYPGAPELCDTKDNDCNGETDEGCGTGGTVSTGTGNIAQAPLFLTQSATPLVMLNMSNDHQLYFSAYNEYDDLDGDGTANATYSHNVNYYGYFDSYKCYDYTANERFEPVAETTDKYCTNQWSGNFLNWASMARIDAVRKILYGGDRSTDSATRTVLERSYLPNDGHSWVKYYPGNDIDKLTPFSPATQAVTKTSSSSVSIGTGDKTFSTSSSAGVKGDQLTIISRSAPASRIMRGFITSVNSGSVTVRVTDKVGNGTYSDWTIVNPTRVGITLCNTTLATSGFSQNVTAAPLLRVAEGNYDMWTANERWQCRWSNEKNISNDNDAVITGLNASRNSPDKNDVGLGVNDYNVRVEVCDSAMRGTETCKRYPDGNYKPVGLLQMYGDDDLLEFGLMTGSYSKNKSGGVLRKNISSILDEINVDTDGTFKSAPSTGTIIDTLNKFRLYGYNQSVGYYNDGDNCPYGITSFNNGSCTNWGNPQSEIFLESLRYFAGKSPTSAFTYNTTDDKISGLGKATWADPLSDANYCAPLNIINFNASMASYDADELETSGSVDLPGAGSAASLTNVVGLGEDIHGKAWFVGENGGSSGNTSIHQLCTPKTVSALGDVLGICPESPRLSGSYHLVGLAHFAYTNSVRTDLPDDQTVKTFGVSLAPAVPKIEIPYPGETTPTVTILPACRNTEPSHPIDSNCAIVNFRKVNQNLNDGTGAFFVQWEDSEQGGDFDQDMAGVLSYVINPLTKTITVETNVYSSSTSQRMGFGFTISGTTEDGFHAYSGIDGFSYNDPSSAPGCDNCQVADAAEAYQFTVSSNASANVLEQPLFYASKWGGYDKEKTFPTDPLSWDKNSDGLPDNYYFSTNPSELEKSLNAVFLELAEQTSSSSAVAANSTQLNLGTVVYQARFNSGDWIGELLAYQVNLDGTIGDLLWNAGELIPDAVDRKIYTSSAITTGAEFTWANLTLMQKAALSRDVSGTFDTRGADRLSYLRGDQSNENQNGGIFRDRPSLLGDIVNSDPYFVGTPDYRWDRSGLPEGRYYKSFRAGTDYQNRPSLVYVGANDGMLHAISATDGVELFAYVPDTIIPELNRTMERNYGSQDNAHRYMVDGSPKASDVYFNSAWHTVLVETLGGGGQGVFALDVTNPQAFDETSVLWEVNSSTTGTGYDAYADLGYTLSDPTIARLPNGMWVAIFGNGYNSINGKALLYIVDISNGSIVKVIDVGVGTAANPNGLSSPAAVDTDRDRIIDTIYAGDLQGNLWKFDVSSALTGDWDVAFREMVGADSVAFPLFKAVGPNGETQPITVRPSVARDPDGGHMVLFGTGKFFEIGDNVVPDVHNDREVQSYYGIKDKDDNPDTRITVLDRSVLQGQIITNEITFEGWETRVVSSNKITSTDNRGWYLDLISPGPQRRGERVVSNSLLRNDRVIFVTLIPSAHPCDSGGSSWLMELDIFNGGSLGYTVFNTNGDSSYGADDQVEVAEKDADGNIVYNDDGTEKMVRKDVSGLQAKNGILQTPTVVEDGTGEEEYLITPDSSGETESFETLGDGAIGAGRHAWRQLQ